MGTTHPLLLPLLRAVHAAHLFPDSKTISDMPLLAPPAEAAAAFSALDLPERDDDARRAALLSFVSQWCGSADQDLDSVPDDVTGQPPGPAWLPHVTDPGARAWAEHLHRSWATLARCAALPVLHHPDQHSLLWLPHPFVIPGARFREAYYWDSLFVVQGLLVCGRLQQAVDLVSNLLYLADAHGFVPNGNRSYYLNRSQPPLLAPMVRAVHAATREEAFLRRALPALVREHAHWTEGAKALVVVDPGGRRHNLSRYYARWEAPRPESHREDVATAAAAGAVAGSAAERALFRNIASAAESGWDFSSRWQLPGQGLGSARTTSVLPADLNAFLFQAERAIAEIAAELGDADVAARFARCAAQRLEAITALHWDKASAQWRDLVLVESVADGAWRVEHSACVAASNWVPLWCGCAAAGSAQARAAVASLKACGLVQPGGVAASLERTGQQWDWPNVWPPLQAMLIEGCQVYGNKEGAALAAELARRYLRSAHDAWAATGRMFEKFDCSVVGAPGGGGEYECVDGFGWTNGVALQLLERYGWADG